MVTSFLGITSKKCMAPRLCPVVSSCNIYCCSTILKRLLYHSFENIFSAIQNLREFSFFVPVLFSSKETKFISRKIRVAENFLDLHTVRGRQRKKKSCTFTHRATMIKIQQLCTQFPHSCPTLLRRATAFWPFS